MTPLFVGPEILVVVALIVLLFGASYIPKLGRNIGKVPGMFKRGREKSKDDAED
jgi:TatA/E family protein of Tat protein translocase